MKEKLWTAEVMNKVLKAFREDRRFRFAADILRVTRIFLSRRLISESNATNSKATKTVFAADGESRQAVRTVLSHSPTCLRAE
jgi:hypothetical protein